MPGPTTSWNLVRLYGTWRSMNGALRAGTYKITVPARITNHTDDSIIPAGVFSSGLLQTSLASAPSLDVMVPATDDPDNDQTNWNLQVEVSFTDAAGEKYSLTVPYADRPVADGGTDAGVNLRTVAIAAQMPQTVALYRVGVPGGLARLNELGQVMDSQGAAVVGTGSGSVNSINGISPDGTGAVTLAKANIPGMDLVDNTHDVNKTVAAAAKWTTARILSLAGELSGSVSFDGSANATLTATVAGGGVTGKAIFNAATQSDAWGQLGVVPTNNLPALAINDTFTVANQTARLALTAQRGDMAFQTDTSTWYILAADAPATDANWKAISVPALVQSVNGKTGVIALTSADVSAVPTTRTVAGQALTADVTATQLKTGLALTAADVGVSTGTTATAGLVALATTAQANAGTDTTHAVTPAGLSQILAAIATMPIIVQWDGLSWGTYSNDATRVRMFLSQNDLSATTPTAYNAHDLWFGATA